MRFTLFNTLQIFKLTMKLTIQSASVEAERTFNAWRLFVTKLWSRSHDSTIDVLHKKCVAKAVNVKNACFSYRLCSAGFNPI